MDAIADKRLEEPVCLLVLFTLKWQNLEKLEKNGKSTICFVGQAIIYTLQRLSEEIFLLCTTKSSQGLLMQFRIISNWQFKYIVLMLRP